MKEKALANAKDFNLTEYRNLSCRFPRKIGKKDKHKL